MDSNNKAQNKLAGNALSGMVSTVIYMVSRLLLTPFTLHYLSLAEFGLWSLTFIILSYAGMGGFGVNSTYIRYSARYLAEGKTDEISKLLSTGIAYMMSFSMLFCSILYMIMPFVLYRFHIEQSQQQLATTVILGTAMLFCFELTLGGIAFIINGMHEFAKEKLISTISGLFEIILIIAFLYYGYGIKGLLYAFALRIAMTTGLCWKVARTLLPSLSISWKLVSREHLRHFLGFGGKVQFLGIIGIFLTAIDRMFITAISGLSAGGIFELGRKLPSTAGGIATSAFAPFLSTAAHIESKWVYTMNDSIKTRITNYIHVSIATASLAIIPIALLPSIRKYLAGTYILIDIIAIILTVFLFYKLYHNQKNNNYLDSPELKELYINGIRFTNIISSTLFTFLVAMAYPIINGWVGAKYTMAANIMIFLSIGYGFQQCTGPITMIYRGLDKTGKELEYAIVQLILMIIWIPTFTYTFGLVGSAAAITFSSLISTLFLFWRSGHIFQIRTGEFIVRSILPSLVPFLPAYAIFIITQHFPANGRIALLVQVFTYGAVYLLLTSFIFWSFILNSNEKKQAINLLPFCK